jgi:hypothetical protein
MPRAVRSRRAEISSLLTGVTDAGLGSTAAPVASHGMSRKGDCCKRS